MCVCVKAPWIDDKKRLVLQNLCVRLPSGPMKALQGASLGAHQIYIYMYISLSLSIYLSWPLGACKSQLGGTEFSAVGLYCQCLLWCFSVFIYICIYICMYLSWACPQGEWRLCKGASWSTPCIYIYVYIYVSLSLSLSFSLFIFVLPLGAYKSQLGGTYVWRCCFNHCLLWCRSLYVYTYKLTSVFK